MNGKAVKQDLLPFVELPFPTGSSRAASQNGDGQRGQDVGTLRLVSDQGSHTALVPKDWLSGPVFKPGIQRKNTAIIVGERAWHMGADNPLTGQPSADIDLSHVRIILNILSFWCGGKSLHLSMGELARRCASSCGGRYFRDLRRKMEELRHYWISVVENNGTSRTFPLLQKIEVVTKRSRNQANRAEKEIWLDKVELAEPFAELLRDWTQIMHLNLDTLKELTSDLAQAIYLYLPSRAFHHTENNPFEIRLALLLEQLGMAVPSAPSKRRELFTQNKRNVLAQLDGAEILSGKLRVSLAPAGDGSDYKLLAWVEKGFSLAGAEASDGPLVQAWLAAGKSRDDYDRRRMHAQPLLEYEEDALLKAGVSLDNCRSFFSIAKSLLGQNRFDALISEAKAEALEGRGASNPTGAIIYRITRSF